jgi:hypothetical protein
MKSVFPRNDASLNSLGRVKSAGKGVARGQQMRLKSAVGMICRQGAQRSLIFNRIFRFYPVEKAQLPL